MRRLLIVETIPDRHKAFEGDALKLSLEIMKKGWDGRASRHLKIDVEQAFTKKSFFDCLEEETDYLHISSHGKRNKENHHVLVIGKSEKEVTPAKIREHKPVARYIFISACCAGHEDLANAFFLFDEKKSGFYLAPVNEVRFDEAFLVALQFHRGAFARASKGQRSWQPGKKYVEELKSIKKTYALFEFPQCTP